jgi:hypothetical protein
MVAFKPAGMGDSEAFRELVAVTHVLKYSRERMVAESKAG